VIVDTLFALLGLSSTALPLPSSGRKWCYEEGFKCSVGKFYLINYLRLGWVYTYLRIWSALLGAMIGVTLRGT